MCIMIIVVVALLYCDGKISISWHYYYNTNLYLMFVLVTRVRDVQTMSSW